MRHVSRSAQESGEWGQSIVELALVVPVLTMVLFAVIEFGLMISYQITLTNAARDGARAYALTGGTSAQGTAAAQAAIQSAAPALTYCSSPSYTPSGPAGTPTQVGMAVSCTYQPMTPLGSLVRLVGGTLNLNTALTGSAVMRVEQ